MTLSWSKSTRWCSLFATHSHQAGNTPEVHLLSYTSYHQATVIQKHTIAAGRFQLIGMNPNNMDYHQCDLRKTAQQ